LNQELTRASSKPQFLQYFGEVGSNFYSSNLKQIADNLFAGRYADFLSELVRRLKLGPKMSLLIALSLQSTCTSAAKQ